MKEQAPVLPARRATAPRLTLALLSPLAALLLTLPLVPWLDHTRFVLFFGSILFAAAMAGPAVAAATLVVSLVLAELYVFRDPDTLAELITRDGALILISVPFILLVERMGRVRARAERTLADMEQLNRELTRQTELSHRAAVRAERLHEMLGLLLNRNSPVAVATVIVDEGRRAVDATAAVVVVRREQAGLEVLASHGYSADVTPAESPALGGATPLGEVLRTGEAVWLQTAEQARQLFPAILEFARPDSRAWAALPLAIEGRLLGALGFSFAAEGSFPDEDRAFMMLLAQQCAQALDRARLHQLELEARVRAEFAERRLSLLSEASARLGASLDYVATLNNVAWLAVPEIADWCAIHLENEGGEPQLVALAHADPARLEARRALELKYPSSRASGAPYAAVLKTGEPVHIPVLTDEHIRAAAHDEEHYAALRALRLRSQIAVPVQGDDRVLGVLTLAHAESGRSFTEADVTLAQELGHRAGVAVHNARLYATVQHANETKADFLAVMSHELRTPLNAIIGYSDLLLMGVPQPVPEHAQRQVQRIRGASTSLLHLVEEILMFSRVEAGKEDLRISPVDLGALVADCVAMIEPMAAEKNLAARYLTPCEPIRIISDERKIRQIVTNLLSNAVKFTESGSLTAEVAALDDEVQVTVTDTGIGIPPEHQERIFEPFWQVEASSTRRFGGTGLGLGVARKLARLLEGRLDVRSAAGKGSTFVLSLPLHTPGLSR